MSDGFNILIVDDEPNIRAGLSKGLKAEADKIATAGTAAEALRLFLDDEFQLVIADVRLPGEMDGLELVSQILEHRPRTTVIVITAHGTVETAVDAMRRGAFDFITKPVDLNLIRQQVGKALRHHRLQDENRELRERLAGTGEISGIIGNCTAIQDVFRQIRQVADTDATVMIQGESGTGKELVARALHDLSRRCDQPFVAINLGALPETLLESELFGHEKGSFSGATRQKPGCFEQACRGTLFLDEVTEMSAKSQVDLLRVLESGTFTRVGGEQQLTSQARIVSATNQDPLAMVAEGTFRDDLFYRLNVVPIEIPALREQRARHSTSDRAFSSTILHSPRSRSETSCLGCHPSTCRSPMARKRSPIAERGRTTRRYHVGIDNRDQGSAQRIDFTAARDHFANEDARRSLGGSGERTDQCNPGSLSVPSRQDRQGIGVSVRTLHYKMSRYGIH